MLYNWVASQLAIISFYDVGFVSSYQAIEEPQLLKNTVSTDSRGQSVFDFLIFSMRLGVFPKQLYRKQKHSI